MRIFGVIPFTKLQNNYSRRPVLGGKTRAGLRHIQVSKERETQHANLGRNAACEFRTKHNMRIFGAAPFIKLQNNTAVVLQLIFHCLTVA